MTELRPHRFDGISREDLDIPSSRKWSFYPGTIGAWVAETDFGTAPSVTQALQYAIDTDHLGYPATGIAAEARAAVARWQLDAYQWEVTPRQVHLVSDVLQGLRLALDAFAPPGSAVIVPTPAYMPFMYLIPLWGYSVIEVPGVVVDGRWQHDLEAIDAALAAGASTVVLCNPHNPTGTVATAQELADLADVVDRHGARVFADEIHAPLTFGVAHVPYASVSEAAAGHALTAVSASKAWNIAGLKCAQLITSNAADTTAIARLGYSVPGPSTPGIVAATAAYNDGRDWLTDVVDYLDGNRLALSELLEGSGIGYRAPDGTYLGWLDFRGTALGDGRDIAAYLREHAGVALTDGLACGRAGAGFARVVLAMPRPLLTEVAQRVVEATAAAGA